MMGESAVRALLSESVDRLVSDLRPLRDAHEARFTLAAADALRRVLSDDWDLASLRPTQLLEMVASLPANDAMIGGRSRFSDLQLTLYCDEAIAIQMMVWLTGTTSIHDHGFYGAFGVMAGNSLHTEFDFEFEAAPCDGLAFGRLRCRDADILRPGCVRPILVGERAIHSVYHMGFPSVSILVAGGGEAIARSNVPHEYVGRRLRVRDDDLSVGAIKKAQSVRLLSSIGGNGLCDALTDLIETVPARDMYGVVRGLDRVLRDLSVDELARFLGALDHRGFRALKPVIDTEKGIATLINLRARQSRNDVRLLIALLALVDDPILWHPIVSKFVSSDSIALSSWADESSGGLLSDPMFRGVEQEAQAAFRTLIRAYVTAPVGAVPSQDLQGEADVLERSELMVLLAHIDWRGQHAAPSQSQNTLVSTF